MDAMEERNSLRGQVKAAAKYIEELRAAAEKAESLTARQSFLYSARSSETRLGRHEVKLQAAEDRVNRVELRAAADKAESLTARQSFLDSARDNEKRLARLEFKLHAAEDRLNRESKGS